MPIKVNLHKEFSGYQLAYSIPEAARLLQNYIVSVTPGTTESPSYGPYRPKTGKYNPEDFRYVRIKFHPKRSGLSRIVEPNHDFFAFDIDLNATYTQLETDPDGFNYVDASNGLSVSSSDFHKRMTDFEAFVLNLYQRLEILPQNNMTPASHNQ